MKKKLLLWFVFCGFSVISQTHNCGEDKLIEVQKSNLSNYDQVIDQVNLNIKNYIADNFNQSESGKSVSVPSPSTYIIPVVFHVVHPSGQTYGTGANISYSQIQSQLNALNAAFAKSYPSYNGQTHAAYAQNTNIQFCLAKIASPTSLSFYNGPGGTEYGVVRYPDNALTNHQITNASATALLGLTHPTASHFPFSNYLNIWIVSSIGNGGSGTIMGYAPKPIMNSYPLDGVIMRSDIIGDNTTGNNFNLGYGLTQGKVLAHEVGHYFNLYHIFQGGCSGANAQGASTDACDLNGDFICDIEPCTTQNYNCNLPVPNTCSASYSTGTTTMDMIESYMSYADDDCMNTFTQGQKQRMQATLNTLRSNLWQTSNLSATGIIGPGGCVSPFLMSTIQVSTNNICSNSPIILTNPQQGNTAISYTWSLAGGSPSIANTNSVIVTYTSPGLYWAKLKVYDGNITAKDSFLVKVANCSLDSTRLDRANWYFSDFSGINFNTIPASAIINSNMYQGYESTVSMSDKKGNLLFYTNCINFWNKNHQQVNSNSPFLNLLPGNNGSSSPGVIAIPYPKDTSRYILISSPHTGNIYDSIYYAVYNINTNILGPKKAFIHPSLPTKYGEPLTVVPHCNGRDYWVICRPFYNIANSNRAYSVLITPAGPGQIDKVVVSNNITPGISGQFKSNRKGNRLIQADFTSGFLALLYKFDKATGLVSNQLQVPGGGSGTSTGAVFSPNDTFAVAMRTGIDPPLIYQINVQTLATQTLSVPAGNITHQLELGPDNNLYLSQSDYSKVTMSKIINSGSWNNISYIPNALTFPYPAKPFHGTPNFMDADKGPEIAIDYQLSAINCTTYKFSVDSCWQVYTANWSFGDGTTGTGLSQIHTYASAGAYSATLVLSVGNYSLPPVVKNVTVLSATTSISGPPVICLGSPFLNNYGAAIIAGATYSWSSSNANINGPNNSFNINVGAATQGVAVLTVQVVNGGCTSLGTKTITIDTTPSVSVTPPNAICLGSTLSIAGTPAGGTVSGQGVSNNIFNSTITGAGTFPLNYAYTNSNGCSNSASVSITVSQCVGINEPENTGRVEIVPNPNTGVFYVSSAGQVIESIMVTNILGETIVNSRFEDRDKIMVDISRFNDGIYLVHLKTINGVIIKKVIKKE